MKHPTWEGGGVASFVEKLKLCIYCDERTGLYLKWEDRGIALYIECAGRCNLRGKVWCCILCGESGKLYLTSGDRGVVPYMPKAGGFILRGKRDALYFTWGERAMYPTWRERGDASREKSRMLHLV